MTFPCLSDRQGKTMLGSFLASSARRSSAAISFNTAARPAALALISTNATTESAIAQAATVRAPRWKTRVELEFIIHGPQGGKEARACERMCARKTVAVP